MEVLAKFRMKSASSKGIMPAKATRRVEEEGGEVEGVVRPHNEVTMGDGGGIHGAAAESKGEGKRKGTGKGESKSGLAGDFSAAVRPLSRLKADGAGKSREQQARSKHQRQHLSVRGKQASGTRSTGPGEGLTRGGRGNAAKLTLSVMDKIFAVRMALYTKARFKVSPEWANSSCRELPGCGEHLSENDLYVALLNLLEQEQRPPAEQVNEDDGQIPGAKEGSDGGDGGGSVGGGGCV